MSEHVPLWLHTNEALHSYILRMQEERTASPEHDKWIAEYWLYQTNFSVVIPDQLECGYIRTELTSDPHLRHLQIIEDTIK